MIEKWLKDNIGYEIFNPDLTEIKKAYTLLDFDFSSMKIITIAGTNGKGQTSRLIYHQLKDKFKVSLWTSPHILSPCERIRNNEGPISEKLFLKNAIIINEHLKKNSIRLSYFEFLFILFLYSSKESEVLILEVGLGGRLDATNILDAHYVLVTSISRDHQKILGNSYKKILYEKLGVVKNQSQVLSSFELRYLRRLSTDYCKNNIYQDLFEMGVITKEDDFSSRNTKLVKHLVELMGEVFKEVDLNAWEFFNKTYKIQGIEAFLSPAHNPDGVRKLVQFLGNGAYNYDYILISLSDRDFSDAVSMIKSLKLLIGKKAKEITLTHFDHYKAMSEKGMREIAAFCECNFVKTSDEFFHSINKSSKVLCAGSNYFLSTLLLESNSSR